MSDRPSEKASFDRLAESFVARLRKGEHPALSEYVERYPEHAEDIVDLFPALAEMEGLKPDPDDATGTFLLEGAPGGDAPNPTQLGDYRILRLIGQGGMGVVYEARRESLSAHVALKVLHRRFRSDDGFLRRFRNEARAAARLHHTNIVPVFDFGEHDGILYYVMQYIAGQGLDRVMADVKLLRESGTADRPAAGPSARLARSVAQGLLSGHFALGGIGSGEAQDSTEVKSAAGLPTTALAMPRAAGPPESSDAVSALGGEASGPGQSRYHREIARIGAQVADALAHAHSLGIMHRDVKPPNLLLDARGNAWVTDFGLAKCEDGEAALTEPGDVLGTLRYMAPERLSGHSDRSGDSYALGVSLYEMLALRPAFDAGDRGLLVRQILHDEPTPLRKLDPRVPRDLETIVHKAMAKEIASRYASAAEMAEDLRLYLEDRPLKNACRTTPSERAYRWCRRNPLVAGLGTAAVALLLAVLVVSTVAAIREKKSNDDLGRELENVKAAKKEAIKQLARAEDADREKSERLWEANLATARASRYSGRAGRRFDALAALARAAALGRQLGHPPERLAKLRNEAIAALALPDLQITKEFGQWTSDLFAVDVNADFDLFATSDHAGSCVIRRVADDVEVARLPPADRPRMIVFGADRWLADVDHSGGKAVRIWDVAAPGPGLLVDDRRAMASLDFRPDGGSVAILHADGSLTTYDLPGGKTRHDLPPRPVPMEPMIRLHPSLPYLVLTSPSSNSASLIHLETGVTAEVKLPWPDGRSNRGEWSDDGRTLTIPGNLGQGVATYEFAGDPPAARLLRNHAGIPGLSRIVLNRPGDRLFSRGENNATVMTDFISDRVLFEPPGFIALPSKPPTLKADRERRRLFPARVDDPVRRFGYWSVAEGRECRLIVPDSPKMEGRWVGISPDARLAMGVSGSKILFFDVDRGREVGSIPFGDLGTGNFYAAMDPSGCLLTNTFGGCYRWPIRPDPAAPGSIVIGPPERLKLTPWVNMTSLSRDGKVISQAMYGGYQDGPQAGGWLLHPDRREPARNLHPGKRLGQTHVTPDGKWVMFGGSPGPIYVHDAGTGEQVWSMPGEMGRCLFSPDGKWLCTDIDNGQIYSVGTWRPGPKLGHGYLTCFSPDGKLAVLSTGDGPLRLVEVATGREVARFEGPDKGHDHAALSDDGATLVAEHDDGMRVWDLRLIRSELSRMGLDWDAPAFPPRSRPEGPLTVKIVGADLLDPNSPASRAQRILTPLLSGNGAEALLYSSDELIRSGWHATGLAAYDAALRRHPASTHLRMHRGMELFRRERWEAAAEDFRVALAGQLACKFRRQARVRLAWAYHELGRTAEAASTIAEELEDPADTRPGVEKAGLRLLLAEFYALDGKPDLAGREREAAAALHARPAEAMNHLAWDSLVLKAGASLGVGEWNVPTALFLARKAVDLEPGEAMYGNTYGLALYRAGRVAEARAALEANLMLGKDRMEAWDLFPLAMCQHRLGDRIAARESYDRAVAWRKGHLGKLMGDARELADLQAEAGRLIGVTD